METGVVLQTKNRHAVSIADRALESLRWYCRHRLCDNTPWLLEPDFDVPFQIHLVLSLGNTLVDFVLPCSDKSYRIKCHITAVFPSGCLCSISRFLWQFFKRKLLWYAVILHIDNVTWLTKPRLQKHCFDQTQVWELSPLLPCGKDKL